MSLPPFCAAVPTTPVRDSRKSASYFSSVVGHSWAVSQPRERCDKVQPGVRLGGSAVSARAFVSGG